MKQKDITEAMSKHFDLLTDPVIVSEKDKPLRVKFIATNVAIKLLSAKPTCSSFTLQVFNKNGKQVGTITKIRIAWDWEDPIGNTAEIEKYVLRSDFPDDIVKQINELDGQVKEIRSIIYTDNLIEADDKVETK